LVKLFSNEAGSETVKKLVTDPSNSINVLDLALIELQSAIYRKYRNNEVPGKNLEKIQIAIEKQMAYFNTIPMGSDIMKEAQELVKKFGKTYGLRTLDAMHVAGWRIIAEPDWIFVSSDKNQLNVITQLNYKTIVV
jgi:predicted nucleic acid-binding protein